MLDSNSSRQKDPSLWVITYNIRGEFNKIKNRNGVYFIAPQKFDFLTDTRFAAGLTWRNIKKTSCSKYL
jgi:hypothetical protein